MRGSVVKQLFESCRRLTKSVARRGPVLVTATLVTAIVLFAAAASTANAFQEPIDVSQPYVVGYAPYATGYYGTVSPYPIGYYSYPNYVYPGAVGGYSVGYYPYVLPPAYPVPTVAYTVGPYAVGFYSYAGWPYGVYPGWGGAYPYGFGF
jgi:hypothetical protein